MIELGQTVGNYRVVSKLGEGAMGSVFLAEHPIIGRKVALKVIHPHLARNPEVVARFVNEATAINRIGHQHIVEVTDFGRTPTGDFYFVMEHLEGYTLAHMIERRAPLEVARAIGIAAEIADALVAAHARGVIHRDLKPENVFIVARAEDPFFVKVLDFGLAKLVRETGAPRHETRKGIVLGTPYYMAPEQCEGRGQLDERADIYALGVVLFEMLTGHLPFGGDDLAEVLLKQISVPPPAVRSLMPDVPEALDLVVRRALAKRPADRFPTMEALRRALLEPTPALAGRPAFVPEHELRLAVTAARPMSRADITRRHIRPTAPTTRAAARKLGPSIDRIPRHRWALGWAFLGVSIAVSAAVAAGLAHGRTLQHAWLHDSSSPKTVSLTFSSDPVGACVFNAEGTKLGTTPMSIETVPSSRVIEYRFEKEGFVPRIMASSSVVPSALFASLQPQGSPEPEASPLDARKGHAEVPRLARPSRHRRALARRNEIDEDGLLQMSSDR
jgi:serine/threonine-protein kinase